MVFLVVFSALEEQKNLLYQNLYKFIHAILYQIIIEQNPPLMARLTFPTHHKLNNQIYQFRSAPHPKLVEFHHAKI